MEPSRRLSCANSHHHHHYHHHHQHQHIIACPIHHHHHLVPCPHHQYHHAIPAQIPQLRHDFPMQKDSNLDQIALLNEAPHSGTAMLQEQKAVEIAEEEEKEDEPIFVLTDEWMEFFAKSQAKRKQERRQAKKK